MIFPNCDEVVAQDVFSIDDYMLASLTVARPHSETHNYPGTDSADGCGGNSNYDVTWSISRS
jgi:hypothetical protein